ncbi:MAG TPA: tetratricopeptide repeat protein [Candidatus Saccharimonadales bacterium]|nr:tetratricopeptide repeat protein [Candidatus Saccharimonadales bacterium]
MRSVLNSLLYLTLLAHGTCLDDGIQETSPQPDTFQKGLAALKDNRLPEALENLRQAEREHPQDSRIHNILGILLVQMEKYQEAAAEYQEAIRLNPELEDAYRNLGFLRWTQHQLDPARESLRHAVKLAPGDSFAHYYLGRVELDAQRFEQALDELALSSQPLPEDVPLLLQIARANVAVKRLEECRRTLTHIVALPLTVPQLLETASLLLSIHENGAAITLVQRLHSAPTGNSVPWAQFDLALATFLAGDYKRTLDLAQAYLRIASLPIDQAQAWSLIGMAYAHSNHPEEAVKALQAAAELVPNDEEHWLNLTLELMELQRHPEAIAAAQAGLAANPVSYALHLRLGAANLAAGRYDAAEKVFRDLVAAGDPLPTGYIGLAQVLIRTGRAQEAVTELLDAERKLGPQFLFSYFQGLAYDRAGKPSEALVAFQQAVRLDLANTEAHLNLGKTQLSVDHVPEAIAELQETLRLDPANMQAKRLLSRAYRRKGDTENAAKFAEASTDARAAPADELLGDFFVPQWKLPPVTPH